MTSRYVFRDLAWGMLVLGAAMGIVFPWALLALGVPSPVAQGAPFRLACLLAGLAVGGLNFLLARRIVRPRLMRLAQRMQQVKQAIYQATYSGDWSACDPEICRIDETDEGELGSVAQSYNGLLHALHNAHTFEERLRDLNQALSSELDLTTLGAHALRALCQASGAEAGALILERQGEWKMLAAEGLVEPQRLIQSPAFLAVRAQGAPRRITLPKGVQVDAVVAQFTPADVLLMPCQHHGLTLGALVLAARQTFPDSVLRSLPVMMTGLGLALNNALLHDDLQRVAALDPLTGVYNRRFGLARLDEELSRSERSHQPLAVLMLDLDHFKRVNDTYGHLAGDTVLLRTVSLCKTVLREGDVLVRYGGEEFMAILPGANADDARQVAERIRHALSTTPIEIGDARLQVTASLGVAFTPSHTPVAADKLIAEADTRLYAAKASGRDRVVSNEAMSAATVTARSQCGACD